MHVKTKQQMPKARKAQTVSIGGGLEVFMVPPTLAELKSIEEGAGLEKIAECFSRLIVNEEGNRIFETSAEFLNAIDVVQMNAMVDALQRMSDIGAIKNA